MKRLLLLLFQTLLVFGVRVYGQAGAPEASPAAFVWTNTDTTEVFQVAYFRLDVDLDALPEQAVLNLFADSRYLLLVNGATVNFGPARFYPDHPNYDTYDLRPYLRSGQNVIGVKVVNNGAASFQLRRHRPGFIAWGQIETESGEVVDLRTTGGNWIAHRAEGYLESSPKATFALGPMEIYDARKETAYADWTTSPTPPPGWTHPAVVPATAWGPLEPRPIPALTQKMYRPWKVIGRRILDTTATLYAGLYVAPDQSWDGYRTTSGITGHTYIHSPIARTASLLVSPGSYELNGNRLQTERTPRGDENQQAVLNLPLSKGWNRLDASFQTTFASVPVAFLFTDSLELEFSPRKNFTDADFFAVDTSAGGESGDSLTYYPKESTSVNPALTMAWQPVVEGLTTAAYYADGMQIPAGEATALALDFRHKRLGRVVIEYDAPAGTVFDITMTEDTLSDGWPFLMKRMGLYMAARHVAAGGKGRFETLRPYGLRQLEVHVQGHKQEVTIEKVAVINQIYPFREDGDFTCSDPILNDIWKLGWRSLRVCAEDSYTDTPFRERGLYAGDMLPQMAITLTNDTDLRLVRRSLELFQDMYQDLFQENTPKHPDEISLLEDYPLLTLEALDWYFRRTGDTAFVSRLYPAYDHLVRETLSERAVNGLVPNDRVFIEWTRLEKRDVTNTAYQAILYRSLGHLRKMATLLQRDADAGYYALMEDELANAIREHLRLPSNGAYSDGLKEGQLIENTYPITSTWAYLSGLVPPEDSAALFDRVSQQLSDIGTVPREKAVTPYGSFYVLSALLEAGRTETVEAFVRKQWSPMIYKRNDTAWENFDDVANGTLSHAWSGSPTYLLSAYTLGVKLGWPEPVPMDTILVAPQAETVDWAEGTVPHPAGPVHVRWELRGQALWVDVEGPEGIPIVVRPRGRLAEVPLWVNGEPVSE